MAGQWARTELLYGSDGIQKLQNSRVAVFGIGGVGGYTAEALARSGIGALDLIDADTVSLTNLNRQIIALHTTIGQSKVNVMRDRIAAINPACRVTVFELFFGAETADRFCFGDYDYVVDAVDTVSAKLLLAECCTAAGVPLIASMGAGNKKDPSRLTIADIAKTSYDPLAKVMRRELKKRGIRHLTVVYSTEQPAKPAAESTETAPVGKRTVPGSNAFVPPAAGLLIASKVVNDLTEQTLCREN